MSIDSTEYPVGDACNTILSYCSELWSVPKEEISVQILFWSEGSYQVSAFHTVEAHDPDGWERKYLKSYSDNRWRNQYVTNKPSKDQNIETSEVVDNPLHENT